ncbi:MAG TPA: sodium:proton antiporter, partial [Caldimonas sp.]
WLDLRDDEPVERETVLARQAALRAALASLDGDSSPAAKALRLEYEQFWTAVEGNAAGALSQLRRQAVDAARHELAALRDNDTIGDDAFHRVEAELDRAELYAEGGRR